jgi:hypothetical protein
MATLLSKKLTQTFLLNGLTKKLLPTKLTLIVTLLLTQLIAQPQDSHLVPLLLILQVKELLIKQHTLNASSLMNLDGEH